jgi:hypothetical protein
MLLPLAAVLGLFWFEPYGQPTILKGSVVGVEEDVSRIHVQVPEGSPIEIRASPRIPLAPGQTVEVSLRRGIWTGRIKFDLVSDSVIPNDP